MKLITLMLLIISFPVNAYDRKEWKHWVDDDKDCMNTRHEVLEARSTVKVKYRKSKRGNCSVVSGKWNDFYYPEVLTSARKIDIDHVIPLKHANDFGGKNWSSKLKRKFANDPENLVVTNLRYNRQKGAKGIDEWLPINKSYACKYVKKWFYLKEKYSLKVSSRELHTKSLLKKSGCDL